MSIFSFNELSEEQKRSLHMFINSFPYKGNCKSYEEMVKLFDGVVFDYGSSYFSLWEDSNIIATLGVIPKDAAARGEIFLVDLNVREQDSLRLTELLDRAYHYCSEIKNAKFRLGIVHDKYYLIPVVEKSGFKEVDRNLVMQYSGRNILLPEEAERCFKALCTENIKDYQMVENAAFRQAPNGGAIEDEELQDLLEEYRGTDMAGVYYENDKPAGTYTLKIKDDGGWIESIGVAPEFQGRGIGRKLLYKSVEVLQGAGEKKVRLSVFSSNTRAYGLYIKSGFTIENEHSRWYEK